MINIDIKDILIYLRKQLLLGLVLGALIPVSIYKFMVNLAPKSNIESSQELNRITKLKEKIDKIKVKIKKAETNYLQIKYSDQNLEENQKIVLKQIEDLKDHKNKLKKELLEQEKIVEEKIMPSILWHETTLFYVALLAGTFSFLFGASIKIIPLGVGLILGGLYCLFMAHYTFLGKLNGAINLFYVIFIIISMLLLAAFFAYKKEYEN